MQDIALIHISVLALCGALFRPQKLGATNARGAVRERRGNLRGGCVVCLNCV
jgi:hypothetical protein